MTNFIQFLLRLLPFTPSIGGMIVNIIIVVITVFVAFQLNLCSYLPTNIPFENLSSFFQKICQWLIIEFIPKEDSQVVKMLTNRRDIFTQYTQFHFEKVFSEQFLLCKKTKIKDSLRVMYLFKNKNLRE